MKHLLLFILLLPALSSVGQPILSKACNIMRPGDRLIKQQVEYKEPGSGGENALWDFSGQKSVNEHYELKYYGYQDSLTIGREHRLPVLREPGQGASGKEPERVPNPGHILCVR